MKKLLNSNNDRSKPKLLRLLWYLVVFRLVAYLLHMIKPTISIHNFGINLTQFYINFSRQEHQIELARVSINS